jgi:hypothetical protein
MPTADPFETPKAAFGPSPGPVGVDVEATTRLARAHRRVVVVFLAQLVGTFGFVFLVASVSGASETLGGILGGLYLVLVLGLFVALALSLFRLTQALGWSVGLRVLAVLGLFVGLINLIIILVAVGRGNTRLKEAGLPVGLAGDLGRLAASAGLRLRRPRPPGRRPAG